MLLLYVCFVLYVCNVHIYSFVIVLYIVYYSSNKEEWLYIYADW